MTHMPPTRKTSVNLNFVTKPKVSPRSITKARPAIAESIVELMVSLLANVVLKLIQ